MADFYARTISMEHKGGTKSYHIKSIWNRATNKALVIFRWGKIGSFGEIQVHMLMGQDTVDKFVEKKLREKSAGGYSIEKDEVVQYEGAHVGLLTTRELGRAHMASMTGEQMQHIIPGFDIRGMKTVPPASFNTEDGFDVAAAEEERKRRAEEGKKAVILTASERAAEMHKDDPTFGAF